MAMTEAHRRSLARELHDTVLQEFMVIVMQLRRLEEPAAPDAASRVAFGLQAAGRGIDCARRLLGELRSPPTERAGADVPTIALRTALTETLDAVLGHTPLRRSLRCPEALVLAPATRHEVVSIVREAATNVVRHAGARVVACRVDVDRGRLRVTVEDDGRGLPGDGFDEGHGLTGMRERAALLGATLRIIPRSGAGTAIELSLPLRAIGRSAMTMPPPPVARRPRAVRTPVVVRHASEVACHG